VFAATGDTNSADTTGTRTWKGRLLHHRQQARSTTCVARPYDWLCKLAMDAPVPHQLGIAQERSAMRERLMELCRELQHRLHIQPDLFSSEDTHRVTAMGVVGYEVNHAKRTVRAGHVHADGRYELENHEVEILHPLCTEYWLHWLINDLGLFGIRPQLDLFQNPRLPQARDRWLAITAYQILQTDPGFWRIRREYLPQALGLNPDLVRIALRSRIRTEGIYLGSNLYSLVWRHERQFRQVERENPQLLPILAAFISEKLLPLNEDPVQEMKVFCLKQGLTPAAWRYLAHHGARLFQLPWRMNGNSSKVKPVIEYTRTLEQAGLPPPPPPAVINTLLRASIDDLDNSTIHFIEKWCPISKDVLKIILRHAATTIDGGEADRFIEQLRGVILWAIEETPLLDKNQRHAGWKWLTHQAEQWAQARGLLFNANGFNWHSALPPIQVWIYRIVPLLSEKDLVTEGIAMRNCVATYLDHCASNRARLFSVRTSKTGKRVANICIYEEANEVWEMLEVAGRANSPVDDSMDKLADYLASLYTQAARSQTQEQEHEIRNRTTGSKAA
jgi:hypothetical protein